MNNIVGTKMLSHIDRIFNDQRPITADIFLNNFCNNNCPYCTYRRWEFDVGARSMSFEDFVKYATRLIGLGVLGFILTGGGEPTISKDFQKIVNWLDEVHPVKYGINTNFNKLAKCNPSYLKVSLDAWDDDSYEKRRGVRAYTQVRKNIVEFAEYKSKDTKLGIQLLAKDAEEVKRFYDINSNLPVDYISIRPMESTCGAYYRTITDEKSNLHPVNIMNEINRIASLDKRVILNYKWDLLDNQQSSCTAQWAQIAINEVGEVMYCCHKPFQIVGHIMDDDILKLKEQAGTNMSLCDIPCRMTGPNYEVANLLAERTDIEFI